MTKTFEVRAQSRVTVGLPGPDVPELADETFGALITAGAIVVERAHVLEMPSAGSGPPVRSAPASTRLPSVVCPRRLIVERIPERGARMARARRPSVSGIFEGGATPASRDAPPGRRLLRNAARSGPLVVLGVVSRGGRVAPALEQPVAGPIPPARRAGEDQAAPEDGFAYECLARVVARVAVAIAAVLAEIVARHHDDVDPRHLVEDVIDDADAFRVLDLNHDQDVVVGVGGIPVPPQTGPGCLPELRRPHGLVFGLSR